jgi:hypothetical protein
LPYRRWALNGEAQVHHALFPRIGQTKVVLGITAATNMDRGSTAFALPEFPAGLSQGPRNKRELGGVVRVEQEVTKWVTLGVRYDAYLPDLEVSDNARQAFAGVFAFHFTKGLKSMLEYDVALDHIHEASAPASHKVISTLSTVFQARF